MTQFDVYHSSVMLEQASILQILVADLHDDGSKYVKRFTIIMDELQMKLNMIYRIVSYNCDLE